MLRTLRQTVMVLVLLSVVTGVIYTLAVTGIAQLLFPHQANGSLVYRDGKAVGSELIGQPFSDPNYFWSRPSATNSADDGNIAQPYNAANSGGSNLGPLNPALADRVKTQAQALREADPAKRQAFPVDLVTASASGLDPDISVASAEYQVSRVARALGLSESAVRKLVEEHIRRRQLGVLGEERVNVLELNLALDRLRH